jgi:hypothetical protein
VAVLMYAAQADFMMERLRPALEADTAERYQGMLAALWPILWVGSIAPLLFMESSYSQMDVTRTLEATRIRRSARSALVLSLTAALLFVLNYIADEFNEKRDLSYFKTTRASETSRKLVSNLSQDVKAILFYPGANEVQDQVEPYFEALEDASKRFHVEVVDHVLRPELAKEYRVSGNGYVVLAQDKQHQQISIGTKLERARRKLRDLDNEFQKAFTKLVRPQRIAYLTVGHEERTDQPRDGVKGSSVKGLRSLLQRLNYQVKDLGLAQGLGSEVPADANLVLVIGPRKPFLPGEAAALRTYLEQGGHMMVFLDAENPVTMEDVLEPFGLKYTPEPLAHPQLIVRMTHTQADRYAIITNRFSSHPSVSTLSRHSNRVAVVLGESGYLEEIPPREGIKPQVRFAIHSMPMTWADTNRNHVYDQKSEKRKVFEVVATASMPASKGEGEAPQEGEEAEMRLLVASDSDMVSDKLLGAIIAGAAGNLQFFNDAVKWVGGEEELIGETTSEEDIRIVHTREEDQLWFYLTIFGVPALVVGGGVYYTRRRRRK